MIFMRLAGVRFGRLDCSCWTGFESPDPVFWTAAGYVVVQADVRGMHRSEGRAGLLNDTDAEDLPSSSNGPHASPGRHARWACWASLISPCRSGGSPCSIRHRSRRWFPGRGSPTCFANSAIRTVCRRPASSAPGGKCGCSGAATAPSRWPRTFRPIVTATRLMTPIGRPNGLRSSASRFPR
jgi:hypothetical protein